MFSIGKNPYHPFSLQFCNIMERKCRLSVIYVEKRESVQRKRFAMIVFAAISVCIIIVIACVGLVCAHFDTEDLHNMGIQR